MPKRSKSKRMKIFQTVQRDMALIGYKADEQPFNIKQIEHGFKSIFCGTLELVYLIFVAETPKEYLVSIFMTSVGFLVFISFLNTVQKMPKIFYLIDEVEAIINESKFWIFPL